MRRVLFILIAVLAVVPSAGAWTWPAEGVVLRPFSFDRELPKEAGQHRGVDVGGAAGSVVRAPATGVVSFVGTVPTNGKCVTIETADGWSVTLTHLGSIAVTKGATVAEGDGVGTIGPSDEPGVGDPHVHLGIRWSVDEYGYVDPVTMLPGRLAGARSGQRLRGGPAGSGS
jgi:murein DD-endopeptidase MepM/ murein hydrolase activator NlpD